MNKRSWPDDLVRPQPASVEALLRAFWLELASLPGLLLREEHLLAAECTGVLRRCVLEMMLALNGIAYPAATRHLNLYLGPSQRAAIARTLQAPAVAAESWLGQAVALVVIYRWYAPQLVVAYGLPYDDALEQATLAALQAQLPDWPQTITTDPVHSDPVLNDPVLNDPVLNDPVLNDPVLNDPVLTDSAITRPAITSPGAGSAGATG